ncbi:S10 family peptidase [Nitrosomonas aestuarii]|nr:peptidase S10 [Nitrosomonas aestuarii]
MISQLMLIAIIVWIGLVQMPVAMSAEEGTEVKQESPSEARASDLANQSVTTHIFKSGQATLDYTATAASVTVHDKQSQPAGQIFYVAYTMNQPDQQRRPLTFVFNGGPGAASAYLHLGALGPKRVVFNKNGTVPTPTRIVDNPKSWLAFTDLVFVDPIGTGYSRKSGSKETSQSASDKQVHGRSQFWGVEEDVHSLSRFIRNYLTEENRWLSPVYLAGESYGGFRVARLSRRLQADYGIAPSGLILISPVLDFSFIWGGEYSLWPWVSLLPSYAAVAAIHQRSDQVDYIADRPRDTLIEVERFALTGYLSGLAAGTPEPDWLDQVSNIIALDKDTLQRSTGRISAARFVKTLLADQRRLLSLYDGSITLIDPDPAKQFMSGRDLYLDRLNAPVTAAFNSYVRKHLTFKSELPYLLLNKDVSSAWNWRSGIHGQQGFAEAVSDLKLAMSLNPDMRVKIVHGVFDLVTPYFASEILIRQMALDPKISRNIELNVYHGGHMFYFHEDSLNALYSDALRFYKRNL